MSRPGKGVTRPLGFTASGAYCAIRKKSPDLAVIASDGAEPRTERPQTPRQLIGSGTERALAVPTRASVATDAPVPDRVAGDAARGQSGDPGEARRTSVP